ncbi:MAG: hypothetical protein Q4E10_04400 [Porphyromonas sp.]|nr:hypothetical protein [Porphyromonas sp.]
MRHSIRHNIRHTSALLMIVRRLTVILAVTFAITLAVTGCRGVSDERAETPAYRLQVALDNRTPLKSTEMGVETLNENKITSLAVAFYKGDLQVWAPSVDSYTEGGIIQFPYSDLPNTLIEGDTYTVYAFANLPPEVVIAGKTLTQLKNIDLTTPTLHQDNGTKARPSFTMIGHTDFVFKRSNPSFGKVELKRHLAKVKMTVLNRFGYFEQYKEALYPKDSEGRYIEDDFWGVPQVRLSGINRVGSLIPQEGVHRQDFENEPAYLPLTIAYDDGENGWAMTQAYPHYSYPLYWYDDIKHKPLFDIRIPFYHGTEINPDRSQATYYYYTGDFFNREMEGGKEVFGNWLYDIRVDIDALGSTRPESPTLIASQLTVKDYWGNEEIIINTTDHTDYFHVSPVQTEMYNNSLEINFSSSSPLSRTDITLSGYYTIYDHFTGVPEIIQIPSNDLGDLLIIGRTTGKITFTKPVPTIAAPHHITLTINIDGMVRQVQITQYPDIVVTTEQNPDKVGDIIQNPNMFIFRLTRSNGQEYMVGYPDLDHLSPEDENKVSPHFQVSTWNRGAAGGDIEGSGSYDEARTFCALRVERGAAGNLIDDWRLPTAKEISIISRLTSQKGGITEGQDILVPNQSDTYWTITGQPIPNDQKRVRCVRDIIK